MPCTSLFHYLNILMILESKEFSVTKRQNCLSSAGVLVAPGIGKVALWEKNPLVWAQRVRIFWNAFSKFVDFWRNLTPKPQTILALCDWETFCPQHHIYSTILFAELQIRKENGNGYSPPWAHAAEGHDNTVNSQQNEIQSHNVADG